MTTITRAQLSEQLLLERQTPDRDTGRRVVVTPLPEAVELDLTELIAALASNLTDDDGALLIPATPIRNRNGRPARR